MVGFAWMLTILAVVDWPEPLSRRIDMDFEAVRILVQGLAPGVWAALPVAIVLAAISWGWRRIRTWMS